MSTTLPRRRRGGGRTPGVYNIVDDEPAPVREWLPELARMLGAKPPFTIPRWLGRIAAGEHMVVMMTESRAGSNRKARNGLGWAPAHPSWRQGFAELLDFGVWLTARVARAALADARSNRCAS